MQGDIRKGHETPGATQDVVPRAEIPAMIREHVQTILEDAFTLAKGVGIPEGLAETGEALIADAVVTQCNTPGTFRDDTELKAFVFWANLGYNASVPRQEFSGNIYKEAGGIIDPTAMGTGGNPRGTLQ